MKPSTCISGIPDLFCDVLDVVGMLHFVSVQHWSELSHLSVN